MEGVYIDKAQRWGVITFVELENVVDAMQRMGCGGVGCNYNSIR